MQEFSIVHEFDGRPEQYWDLYLDDGYNRAFYAAVDVVFDVLEEVRDGGRITRAVRYRSTQPVAPLMKPFLKDGLGYDEHATLDRTAGRVEQTVVPNAFADRVDIRGTITVEAISSTRIRRTYAGTVAIDVALLGRKMEAQTIAGMQKAQDIGAGVTREWLARAAEAA
ncbi:MAG TPA: DUF2505 family protein [Labilithrix sp.]|nr:DUF2505 family protein [Labilithrix sp.]